MPTTSLGITYPASTEHTRLWEHIQAVADDTNGLLALPAYVEDEISGAVGVAATSWSTLGVSTSITNPHSTLDMLVEVKISASMVCGTTGDVRADFVATGTASHAAGASPSEYLWLVSPGTSAVLTNTVLLSVAPGTATFTMQGMRSGSGSAAANYPKIRVNPLRYLP